MPNLAITGSIHDAVPRPFNNAGSISTRAVVGQPKVDVVTAIQGDLALTQEVQSFINHISLSSSPPLDYWASLFAVRDVVKRLVESCGDVTAENTFQM